MRKTGREPITMIDLDHISITAETACFHDLTSRGGFYSLAVGRAKVDSGVKGSRSEKRITAHAEQAGYGFPRSRIGKGKGAHTFADLIKPIKRAIEITQLHVEIIDHCAGRRNRDKRPAHRRIRVGRRFDA